MAAEGPFFLSGEQNGWRPADPGWRLRELSQPYGRDEWGREQGARRLSYGSYALELDLPAGPFRFKILEGTGWEQQWSTMRYHTWENDFGEHRFETTCGLSSGVLVPRGGGMPPHVEVELPGGRVRFDFSPAARTLAVHDQLARLAGPQLRAWRTFTLPTGAVFDAWVCLPYGYEAAQGRRYPLCLLFDGRSMLTGEDLPRGVLGLAERQFPRVFDTLTRHGLIPPTVVVGIEVPRDPSQADERELIGKHDRRAAFTPGEVCEAYMTSLLEEVTPALAAEFPLEERPLLFGHSWGADFALRLLAQAPKRWRGALALCPANPLSSLEALPEGADLRVAVPYGRHDLGPFFLTRGAACGRVLSAKGIPHLVQLCPDQSHDPHTFASQLPAPLAFLLG